MASWKFQWLLLFLLALSQLHTPASPRLLQGEKANPGKEAPAPTAAASGTQSSDLSKESAKSSFAIQNPDPETATPAPPGTDKPATSASQQTKDLPHSPPPPPNAEEGKGQATPPPPTLNVAEGNPPPGPTDGAEAKGGQGEEDSSGNGKENPTDKIQEEVEKCGAEPEQCHVGKELIACLQSSHNGSTGLFVVVQNKGQNSIHVDINPTSNIDVGKKKLEVPMGVTKKVKLKFINKSSGEITISAWNRACILHIMQPVSDWQQQFQQITAYAAQLKPIYGAYLFVSTVVLVGTVWACCKFTWRRGDAGVPYQQLEMGTQAPSSAVADNTTSTVDGWEDGWDDDWDDGVVAKPSDKKPAESIAANGHSSSSQTNSKDGWDVDWDD